MIAYNVMVGKPEKWRRETERKFSIAGIIEDQTKINQMPPNEAAEIQAD